MMAALAAWTDAFEREYHRRTGQTAVLEDLSPGNFLWDAASRKITGLDFEFWHTGRPAENRGGLLCMAERLKAAEITGEELTPESCTGSSAAGLTGQSWNTRLPGPGSRRLCASEPCR